MFIISLSIITESRAYGAYYAHCSIFNYDDINWSNSIKSFQPLLLFPDFFLNFVLNTEDQTLLCYNMYIEKNQRKTGLGYISVSWLTTRFGKLVNYMQFWHCDYAVNYTHVNWKVLRVNARCIYAHTGCTWATKNLTKLKCQYQIHIKQSSAFFPWTQSSQSFILFQLFLFTKFYFLCFLLL